MLLIYLYVACQTDTVTQERDSVVLNEQQRYADFVRGLQAKSEQLLPEAVYTQEALFAEVGELDSLVDVDLLFVDDEVVRSNLVEDLADDGGDTDLDDY